MSGIMIQLMHVLFIYFRFFEEFEKKSQNFTRCHAYAHVHVLYISNIIFENTKLVVLLLSALELEY